MFERNSKSGISSCNPSEGEGGGGCYFFTKAIYVCTTPMGKDYFQPFRPKNAYRFKQFGLNFKTGMYLTRGIYRL